MVLELGIPEAFWQSKFAQ